MVLLIREDCIQFCFQGYWLLCDVTIYRIWMCILTLCGWQSLPVSLHVYVMMRDWTVRHTACQLLGGWRMLGAWFLLVAPSQRWIGLNNVFRVTNHIINHARKAYTLLIMLLLMSIQYILSPTLVYYSFYMPPCVALFRWSICCQLSLYLSWVETEAVGNFYSVWPAKSQLGASC